MRHPKIQNYFVISMYYNSLFVVAFDYYKSKKMQKKVIGIFELSINISILKYVFAPFAATDLPEGYQSVALHWDGLGIV